MAASATSANVRTSNAVLASSAASVEVRLEQDEIVVYPSCPFPVAEGDDWNFLLSQGQGHRTHKNISYNPRTAKVTGYHSQPDNDVARLRDLLARFSENACAWLAKTVPGYAAGWKVDRVSFRPEEEATRQLRLTRRNDLLHVDAFPTRPSQGMRLFRLFVNINPTEARVWATSLPFRVLLERYGEQVGYPSRAGRPILSRLTDQLLGLFDPGRKMRTPYDEFMLRLHDFLKRQEKFQEKAPKKIWNFTPGSCWLVFTDSVSHAALRGRYALEHSFFVPLECLALPAEAPAALLEKACGHPVLRKCA